MGTSCPTSPLCHSSLRQIWPRKQVSFSDLQFCMCLYNRVFRPHCATGYLELSDAVADANHLRRWTLFTKHYFTLFFFCEHCHVDPFPRYCKPPPSLKWISTSSKVEFDFTWKPRESWFNCPVQSIIVFACSHYFPIAGVPWIFLWCWRPSLNLLAPCFADKRLRASRFSLNYLKSKQRFC